MKLNLNDNMFRRIISLVTAVLVSFIVEYYYSMSHDYLIPITAVFVMLTPIGNLIYHSIKRYVLIVVIVAALSFVFPPHHLIYTRLYDASIGAVIGIVINLLILPRRADDEFRKIILPILKTYEAYFSVVIDSVFEKDIVTLENIKQKMEYELQQLPDWVYERGFDIGLKRGHQYFVMKLHHVAEILFSMHHATRTPFDEELRTEMHDSMYVCAEKIKFFFKAFITVFELKKLTEGVEDFEQDLHDLDARFQTLIPVNLEVLDMSNEDVAFYALIYGLNDLRKALIKLGQALR